LERIQEGAETIDNETAEEHPATAHMFIINPLHAHAIDGLFSTHPATENRVRRLREMAPAVGPWG
jgi:heat shock protein HtpX